MVGNQRRGSCIHTAVLGWVYSTAILRSNITLDINPQRNPHLTLNAFLPHIFVSTL